LPTDLIRNLANQFSSKPISKETIPYLQRATNEFFKNISSDLAAYADHAGRKAIDEHDIQMLLQR
jgi:histone H3/H4